MAPADQRRAEIKKWLTAHPDARSAIHTQRQECRTQRQDRRSDTGAASTSSSV
jgi:hypothetical protein